MNKVDWSKAPSDAEACIDGVFSKWVGSQEYDWDSTKMEWDKAMLNWSLDSYHDSSVVIRPDNWKEGEKRMDQIAQNGNGGEVYGGMSLEEMNRESHRLDMETDKNLAKIARNGNNGHYDELEVSIDKTLADRGSRYGEFSDNARISQEIKRIMKSGAGANGLRDTQREALEMIAAKIARIVNGDSDYIDNWHDIIGYAKLVEDELEGDK